MDLSTLLLPFAVFSLVVATGCNSRPHGGFRTNSLVYLCGEVATRSPQKLPFRTLNWLVLAIYVFSTRSLLARLALVGFLASHPRSLSPGQHSNNFACESLVSGPSNRFSPPKSSGPNLDSLLNRKPQPNFPRREHTATQTTRSRFPALAEVTVFLGFARSSDPRQLIARLSTWTVSPTAFRSNRKNSTTGCCRGPGGERRGAFNVTAQIQATK